MQFSLLEKIGASVLICAWVIYGSHFMGEVLVDIDMTSAAAPAHGEAGDAAEKPAATEEPEVDFAALLASADPGDGEGVFGKCKSCHSIEAGGPNKVGPNLHDIVGRDIASKEGFAYSDALAGLEGAWGYDELNKFLENPKGYAAGTKMSFAGLGKPEQRAEVIAYLRENSENPPPLPEPQAKEAAPPATAEAPAEGAEAQAGAPADAPAEAQTEAQKEAPAAAGGSAETPAAPPRQPDLVPAEEVEAVVPPPAEGPPSAGTPEAEEGSRGTLAVPPPTGGPGEQTEAASGQDQAEVGAAAGGGGGELAALLAAGDAAAGETVFRKCKACHTVEQGGANRVGPNLWNVVGRDKASAEGFSYSDALSGLEGDWSYEDLAAYLEDPKGFAPGNKMSFAGLKKPEDRADVILYLREHSDQPPALP